MEYLDNPPHLAELRSMSHWNLRGWCDFAFLGFPAGLVQSPLVYPSFALLTRWGAPLEILYSTATLIGVWAPAAAFWWVTRSRLGPALALVLAATLLTFRGSLIGVSSSLGGMFGFHWAAAALIVLLALLARQSRSVRSATPIALLTAFIGLTHLFVTIALMYLTLIHGTWSFLAGRHRRARLRIDIPALACGALAAAAFWLPNALAHTRAGFESTGIYGIAERFLSATTGPRLTTQALASLSQDPIFHLDLLIQALPLVLVWFGLRPIIRNGDDLPRYGLLLAIVLFACLMIQRVVPLPLLGPQGVRLVYFVKIGLLLGCIPVMETLRKRTREQWWWALGSACVLLLALGGKRLVVSQAIDPRGADIAEVHALWSWLRAHRGPEWGRVYIRNTCWRDPTPLYQSHILARTAETTGVEQLGVYYDIPSYTDRGWLLYTVRDDDPRLIEKTALNMSLGNATHLVLHGEKYLKQFDQSSAFQRIASVNRFAIYRLRSWTSHWVDDVPPNARVEFQREGPGRMHLATSRNDFSFTINESYHPFFRTRPADAARLSEDTYGRLVVKPMTRRFDIVYAPPLWPWSVSVIGLLAIGFLPAALRRFLGFCRA